MVDATVKTVRILKTLTWVKIFMSDNQNNVQCKIFINLNIKNQTINYVIFTS